MEDRFGRKIDYLRISITDRCNLRCRYCMPDGIELVPMEELLTYEEMELICLAAAQAGIRRLKITGGEPLVRPGCVGLVGRLKKIPGIEQVTMTTNGVALGRHLPELLENGLDAVNISLDTLNFRTYQRITGQAKLAVVRSNIGQAVESGLPVKLNVVLQQGINDMEWLDLSMLTQRFPVDVRFIEMMPIGYGKVYRPVYNDDLLKKFQSIYPDFAIDSTIHGNGPAVYYRIPGAMGSIGFISAMHGKFCGGCNRLRLSSRGKLKPCLCFEDEVDLLGIVREGDPGQVKDRLKEAFLKAVLMKPKGHSFEEPGSVTEQKQMVQIGG